MHNAMKNITEIESANCETCRFLGSDGDGYEYNGNWPVCNKYETMSNLRSFPFKKEMKCWAPNFWHSKFADMIKSGTDEELDASAKAFWSAVDSVSSSTSAA